MALIGIDIQGEKELSEFLRKLPPAIQDGVADEVYAYLLNIEQSYPPFHHVARAEAYPEVKGWFSEKQRKWFFASLKAGKIPDPSAGNRTQRLRKGWKIVGKGRNAILVNEEPHAPFMKGDEEQSRLSVKAGWIKMKDDIAERMDRILEKAHVGAKKAIRELSRQR